MNRPLQSPNRRVTAVALAGWLLQAAVAATSCDGEPERPPERSWPPGAVLALNDHPILASEVDALCQEFALLEPQDTPLQLRRLSVSRVIFPVLASRDIDVERRQEAERLAREYREAAVGGGLPSGPLTGPMGHRREGRFADLGFTLWSAAMRTEPGSWAEVLESPGCFHLLRVESRKDGAIPSMTRFTIEVFDFPYLDLETAAADIEAALDRSRLTLLDETWRDAVPATWRYRLHAENP